MKDAEWWAVWTVFLHTIIVSIHAAAHLSLDVVPPAPDSVFIVITYFAVPIASAALMWLRPAIGRLLLLASMLAGLPYGVMYHYVLPGPDNIASIVQQGWGSVFVATTGMLAVLESIGVLLAAYLIVSGAGRLQKRRVPVQEKPLKPRPRAPAP